MMMRSVAVIALCVVESGRALVAWRGGASAPRVLPRQVVVVASGGAEVEMPEPRVGDVVAFEGDWPGESSVGQIRSLQPRAGAWLADVVPLEDQANDVWRLPSASRARKRRVAVDVRDLVPLESEKAAEEDSFVLVRLAVSEGGIAPLTGSAKGLASRAAGYKALDESFKPKGGTPKLDYEAERKSKEDYDALKAQLLRDSALAAAAGLVGTAAVTRNPADCAAFAVGAGGGLGYVFGLSQFADNAGEDQGGACCDSHNARLAYAEAGFACEHCLPRFRRLPSGNATCPREFVPYTCWEPLTKAPSPGSRG